jgi:uncharacterized protein
MPPSPERQTENYELSLKNDRLLTTKQPVSNRTKVFSFLQLNIRIKAILNTKFSNNGVDQLCPNCGLCCDSVLFADVELRAGDDAKRLAQLGLTIENKTRTKLAFAQPCACFDGKLCRIYADRPKRCRTFECGLLKRVQAGELDADVALKSIAKARRQAETVRQLLRQLGQNDEQLPMTKRYATVMSAPIDLSGHESHAELRGELMLAVDELMRQLQRDFLK